MSFQHTLAMTYTAATGAVASIVNTYTGDRENDFSPVGGVPANAVDHEYDLTITLSHIVAMAIYSDQAVTIRTNKIQTPAPVAPTLGSSAAGTLGAVTYFVKITYTDDTGETTPSPEASLAVAANDVLVIDSPAAAGNATGYNVYAGTSAGDETRQNASPIAIGTDWTEPTSGLTAGAALPTTNTTAGPTDTVAVAAKQLIEWTNDSSAAKPFTADVTKLYVSNANGTVANLTIRVLENV